MRAERYAALGDPVRLAIVDALVESDRAPVELRRMLGLESNLLAHHLDTLERVGLLSRTVSTGDGRRRYLHLERGALDALSFPVPGVTPPATTPLFVCTRNSARSQLAAALWRRRTGSPATSAGTHPADRVHPGAVAAARRHRLDLGDATPRVLDARDDAAALVITVCDRAHEDLDPGPGWRHWSLPDPVPVGTKAAFDATVDELGERIDALVGVRAS
ncbi:MAG: helix-turn-helix domain-containing protein [Acidimicrobiales bacterium]